MKTTFQTLKILARDAYRGDLGKHVPPDSTARKVGQAARYAVPTSAWVVTALTILAALPDTTYEEIIFYSTLTALLVDLSSEQVAGLFKKAGPRGVEEVPVNLDDAPALEREQSFYQDIRGLIRHHLQFLESLLAQNMISPGVKEAAIKGLLVQAKNLAETDFKADVIKKKLQSLSQSAIDIHKTQVVSPGFSPGLVVARLDERLEHLQYALGLVTQYRDSLQGLGEQGFGPAKFKGLVVERLRKIIAREPADIEIVKNRLQKREFIFGKHVFVRVLGAGGMGIALLCYNLDLYRREVIKIRAPLEDKNHEEEFAQRFKLEGKVAALLESNGIAKAYLGKKSNELKAVLAKILASPELALNEEGIDLIRRILSAPGEISYYVTEFVPGGDLESFIRLPGKTGKIPPLEALKIADKILEPIGFYGKQGMVHRDLKPENIMLGVAVADLDYVIKVIDFGLVKYRGEDLDSVTRVVYGRIMGSPLYLSHDQIDSNIHEVDLTTDFFAWGCILIEMLTGATFFSARNVNELIGKRRELAYSDSADEQIDQKVQDALANVPLEFKNREALAKLLAATLAVAYATRPKNVEQIRARLLPIMRDEINRVRASQKSG